MISAVLVTIIIDSSNITFLSIVKHHPNDQNVLYRTEIDNYGVDISYIRVLTLSYSPCARSRPSPKTMPNDETDVDSSDLKHVGKPVGCANGLGNVILGVVHVIQSIWTRSQTRHSGLARRLVLSSNIILIDHDTTTPHHAAAIDESEVGDLRVRAIGGRIEIR